MLSREIKVLHIIKHHKGAFAAKLQHHALEIAFGGVLQKAAAHIGGAGERKNVDIHVPTQSFAHKAAGAGQHLKHAFGNPGLCRQFGQLGGLWWERGEPVRLRMQAAKPAAFPDVPVVDWLE